MTVNKTSGPIEILGSTYSLLLQLLNNFPTDPVNSGEMGISAISDIANSIVGRLQAKLSGGQFFEFSPWCVIGDFSALEGGIQAVLPIGAHYTSLIKAYNDGYRNFIIASDITETISSTTTIDGARIIAQGKVGSGIRNINFNIASGAFLSLVRCFGVRIGIANTGAGTLSISEGVFTLCSCTSTIGGSNPGSSCVFINCNGFPLGVNTSSLPIYIGGTPSFVSSNAYAIYLGCSFNNASFSLNDRASCFLCNFGTGTITVAGTSGTPSQSKIIGCVGGIINITATDGRPVIIGNTNLTDITIASNATRNVIIQHNSISGVNPVRTVSANTTLNKFDELILVDTSTSAITITLPSLNSYGSYQHRITIKDLGNAGTNNITINAATGQSIEGSSSYIIGRNYEKVTLTSYSGSWLIDKEGLKRTLVYSNSSLTLTAGSGNTMIAVIDDPANENYTYEIGLKNLSTINGFSFIPLEWNSFLPTLALDWNAGSPAGNPKVQLWAQANNTLTATISLKIWRVEH
jgi:hypothetical protein